MNEHHVMYVHKIITILVCLQKVIQRIIYFMINYNVNCNYEYGIFSQ